MRILVVEDEPRMARTLRDALAEEGHDVTVATDCTEALGSAQK
jgi:DNA-binding response OmpR family regulator